MHLSSGERLANLQHVSLKTHFSFALDMPEKRNFARNLFKRIKALFITIRQNN